MRGLGRKVYFGGKKHDVESSSETNEENGEQNSHSKEARTVNSAEASVDGNGDGWEGVEEDIGLWMDGKLMKIFSDIDNAFVFGKVFSQVGKCGFKSNLVQRGESLFIL